MLVVPCVMDNSNEVERLLPNMLSLPELDQLLTLNSLKDRFTSVPDWVRGGSFRVQG